MGLFGRRGRGAPALPEPPLPEPPLPVPPFPPDSTAVGGPAPFAAGADPAAVLAAHGVALPGGIDELQAATDSPVWTVPVDDAHSGVRLWAAVRDVHDRTGLWPVLIDEGFWETTAFVGLEEQPPPVRDLDAAAWFATAAQSQNALSDYARGEAAAFTAPDPDDWAERIAEGPDGPDRLLLVPAAAGWEVPGRMGWSGAVNMGWDDGDVHTAVLRRWSGRWGAEVVGMGLDTLNLRVTRPPATPADGLAAAVELALYCPDAVFQGVQTLDALVPMAASSAWWFWWD